MTDESSGGETQDCVACMLPIRHGAKKCVHCDSFQGWRRHITSGDAFLALIVALVSVVSMAIPIFRDTLRTRSSKVTVTFGGTQDGYVFLVASNSGSASGTVAAAAISVTGLRAKFPWARSYNTPPFSLEHKPIMVPPADATFIGSVPLTIDGWADETTFIRPGESKRLRARVAQNRKVTVVEGTDRVNFPSSMRCWLEVDVIQFDGKRETQGFVPLAKSAAESELCGIVWYHGLSDE
jgi:hypothetical protein